jgi:hypothetical protein
MTAGLATQTTPLHVHREVAREPSSGPFLLLRNRDGSVEHYYHFLLGFLFPIIQYDARHRLTSFVVRSCGPLDAILHEVFQDRCRILSRHDHQRHVRRAGVEGLIVLDGFDRPDFYDGKAMRAIAAQVRCHLMAAVNEALGTYMLDPGDKRPLVLFIGRGEAAPFYEDGSAESRFSGKRRRSIPNLERLSQVFDTDEHRAVFAQLETASLAHQIALFSSASIVVAQHGAALTNLVWCKRGTGCVEIMPQQVMRGSLRLARLRQRFLPLRRPTGGVSLSARVRSDYFLRCFGDLSRLNGLRHVVVPQLHARAAVRPHEIGRAIREVLA